MSSIELRDEVSFKELSDALGEQCVLSPDEDEPQFAYLAAIALETYEDESYTVQDTLMEFIRNTSALDNLDASDCDKIETILTQ